MRGLRGTRDTCPASREGVKEARVSFAEKQAEVFLDDLAVSVEKLCDALKKSGFTANKK